MDKDIATIGITDFAQDFIGEICYIELPEVGKEVKVDEGMGSIESYKAVSDIYSPVEGKIVEVNNSLPENPGLMNKSPYKEGWISKVKVKNPKQMGHLLTSEQYQKVLLEEKHD